MQMNCEYTTLNHTRQLSHYNFVLFFPRFNNTIIIYHTDRMTLDRYIGMEFPYIVYIFPKCPDILFSNLTHIFIPPFFLSFRLLSLLFLFVLFFLFVVFNMLTSLSSSLLSVM
eukprot:UN01574